MHLQNGKIAEVNPEASGNANMGSFLDRFMDTKMKLAQIKDVSAAAKLKDTQADDLAKDMTAKDSDWYNRKGGEMDYNAMTPRNKKAYFEANQALDKATEQFYRAEGSKEQAEILKKINSLKNIMLIMQTVSGGLGAIARFK